MKHILSTVALLLFFTFTVSSQETIYTNPNPNLYKGNNTNDYNDVSGLPQVQTKSQEQINLENQIKSLRLQNNTSNSNRIEELNLKLSNYNGNVVKMADYYGGKIEPAENNAPFIQPDAYMNTRIFNSTTATVKALATYTEQIGANAGRIWVVYAFSANNASPDSIRVLYSNDGGITYNIYAYVTLGGTDKVNFDDLDIEIIENTSGNKYLWAVYGIRSSGGTGNWFTGGFNLNITSFAGSVWALSWPGNSSSNRYYNIRLTSDNVVWPGSAWIYLVCSFDSTYGAGLHYNTQKFARVTSTYISTTPTFSYMPTRFYWFQSGDAIQRTLYSDIAFFNNTNDSVIVSFSAIPDSTKIFFSKADGNGNAPTSGHYQGGSDASAYKFFARLSSNGNSNGSIICVFNQTLNSNRNVKYFRTTNFGNFLTTNQSILWGSTTNTHYQPDIVGRRNGNIHYFAFNTIAATDSTHYVSVTTAGSTNHIYKMNYPSFLSGLQGPKPGIRFANNDSCYVLYTESGPSNVWSAAGCSGTITTVGNQNNTPYSYALNQNYPNPFNPTTTISYSIPKNGLVKLVVYDILGKEIATLVNEVKNAGNYMVDFNASNLSSGIYFYKITSGEFSDIKKMTLIK